MTQKTLQKRVVALPDTDNVLVIQLLRDTHKRAEINHIGVGIRKNYDGETLYYKRYRDDFSKDDPMRSKIAVKVERFASSLKGWVEEKREREQREAAFESEFESAVAGISDETLEKIASLGEEYQRLE